MFSLRVLGVLAWLHISIGRVLAWVYAKAWRRYHLGWFDHRFDFLQGPEFWDWQERGILGTQAIPRGGEVLASYSSVWRGGRVECYFTCRSETDEVPV